MKNALFILLIFSINSIAGVLAGLEPEITAGLEQYWTAGDSCDAPVWHDTTFAPCTVGVPFTFTGLCDSCDSVTLLNSFTADAAWNKTTFTLSDSILYDIRDSVGVVAWSCSGDSTDTGYIIIDPIFDTSKVDSFVNNSGLETNTAYYNDSCGIRGYFPRKLLSLVFGSDTLDTVSTSDSLIRFVLPDTLDVGWYTPSVADTNSAADSCDSVYLAGLFDTATITLDPVDSTVLDGDTVAFWITADGTGPISYQWQRWHSSWSNETGETTVMLRFEANYSAENGDSLRCIAYDDRGADTSTAALLTITEIPDTFTVTISLTGSGTGDIDTTPYTADGRYESGTEVTITATPAALNKLVATATFPSSPHAVTIGSDTTIEIQIDTFPKFTVSGTVVGGGSITYIPADSTNDSTLTVACVAVPGVDSTFDGWSGDTTSSNDTIVFTITDNKSVTATFSYSPAPVIDSIRPNPNYRNDSCSAYGSNLGTTGGGMRIISLDDTITVYNKTDTRWDFETGNWSRDRYDLEVWNSYGEKDTAYLRIVIPRVRP